MKKENKEIFYDARYFDNRLPPKDRCVKTGHQTLGQGQMYAIQKSEQFGYCEVAETLQYNVGTVPQEDIVRKWGYLNGYEVDIKIDFEAEKQKAIAAAHRKLNQQPKENIMDTNSITSADLAKATKGKMVTKVTATVANGAKSTTKALAKPSATASPAAKSSKGGTVVAAKGKKPPSKAPAKATGKAAKPAKGSKPKAGAKAPLAMVGATGSLLASLGLREGTKIAKLGAYLCENKGKMLKLKDAVKAAYGDTDESSFSNIPMVINGIRGMLVNKKAAWHVERAKDANGNLTIGLKAGSA